MPSPNSTFTELVATTLRHHEKKLSDNVSKHNALLSRMTSKGRKRSVSGGTEIVEPLQYAENSTYQRYSGYDILNVQASDVLSAAKYDWKQSAMHVTANGRELRINSGREALINLVKSRVDNAMMSFKNNFSADLYSDGTAANQINGLQALISDAGTGVVGGINSASFTFWKSIVQSAAAPLQGGAAITPSATTIQSLMLHLWLELTRGGDKPDLIVSSNEYFAFYHDSLTQNARYVGNDREAIGGFTSLKYMNNCDVVHDGGTKGGGIPNAHMYFVNTDYLTLVTHPDADMTQKPENNSVNQDAIVLPVLWMGNLTCSNRSLQGVLKA